MDNKLFLFVYDIDNNESELLGTLKSLGETSPCLSNGYFIYSDKSYAELFDGVKKIFDNGNGRFLITQINPDLTNGWISTETIDWLRSKIGENQQ